MNQNQRIQWIDGIRGVLCIGIFIHHFLLKYAPESFYGDTEESASHTFAALFSYTPLGLFTNGNFYVFVFVFISGFVVARRILWIEKEDVGKFIVNRYIKLTIPILTVEILYFIFYKLGVGGQVLSDNDGIKNIFNVFENAMIKVPRFGDSTFAGAFWMMSIIYIGSILVTALSSIAWKNRMIAASIYFVLSIALLTQMDFYYSSLFLGSAFGLIYDKENNSDGGVLAWWIILALSLFFGSYPSGIIPNEGVYSNILLWGDCREKSYLFYHWIATALFIISISKISIAQKFFEQKYLLRFGAISYVFYVFHNFMRKILDPLYWAFYEFFGGHRCKTILVDGVVVFILLVLVCLIYERTVAKVEDTAREMVNRYL